MLRGGKVISFLDQNQSNPQIIAIVGLSKNAGKTSFMNWLIKNTAHKRIAVTTTGRDGEDFDLVTGEQKPKVKLHKNILFTAWSSVLYNMASNLSCIESLPYHVLEQKLWLLKANDHLETEVVGPSTLKEQEDLIDLFLRKTCSLVLIDGSFDRKSICLSPKITATVLVVGASSGGIADIVEQLRKVQLCSQIKEFTIEYYQNITYSHHEKIIQSDINAIYGNESQIIDFFRLNPDWVYFPGFLVDSSYLKLNNIFGKHKTNIIFRHPLNICLNKNNYLNLFNNHNVYAKTTFMLSAIAINSYSPRQDHLDVDVLKTEVKKMFDHLPVIDTTEININE